MTIPARIHQTWRSHQLPARLAQYHASWRQHHPDWEVTLYDDRECAEFVAAHYPQLLALYLAYPLAVQRADLFRCLVVHHRGGLYADIDMQCLRPLDRFRALGGAVFSVEARLTAQRQGELGYRAGFQVANCIFAAQPGHWFLARLIEALVQQAARAVRCDADVEEAGGPRLLTRLYYDLAAQEREEIVLLRQIYWMAPTSLPDCWPFNANLYARHHFLGSWKRGPRLAATLHRRWIERSLLPNPWPHTLQEMVCSPGSTRCSSASCS